MSISAYKYRQNDQQDSPHSHPQKYLAAEPNRMSERSIHNTDHNQRLQSRSSTKIEEASRTENGTFKILNKPFSIHRRFGKFLNVQTLSATITIAVGILARISLA